MTIEEKAKAYDRVSKEVKDFFEGRQKMYSDVEQTLEYLFPELAESEDERIRKGIKSILEHYKESGEVVCPYPFVSIDEALAWLEKQRKEDSSIQQAYEYGYTEGKRIERKHWLEKQGEQKPSIEMIAPEENLGIDSETYNKIVDECIYSEQKPACSDDKKLTDVNHEYYSELLENNNSKDINDYAYQVAYCMSHDWIEETATWDDVQKACKLGAEWKEKHCNNSSTVWNEDDEHRIKLLEALCEDKLFESVPNSTMYEEMKVIIDWLNSIRFK